MELISRAEIPEPDTMGDWLRRMGDPKSGQLGLEGLDSVRDKLNDRVLRRDGIKEYTFDTDETEIMGEKAEALFTYNGNKGYMPMLGFLYENPVCFVDEFREGNVAPACRRQGWLVGRVTPMLCSLGSESLPIISLSDSNDLLVQESWMKHPIWTFRWKMVQVAGRIVRYAGEVILKLMIDLEKLEVFRGIRKKSFELRFCPDG